MRFSIDKCNCGLDLTTAEPVNVEHVVGARIIGDCPNCGLTYTLTEDSPAQAPVRAPVAVPVKAPVRAPVAVPVKAPVRAPKVVLEKVLVGEVVVAGREEEPVIELTYEFVPVPKKKSKPTE